MRVKRTAMEPGVRGRRRGDRTAQAPPDQWVRGSVSGALRALSAKAEPEPATGPLAMAESKRITLPDIDSTAPESM